MVCVYANNPDKEMGEKEREEMKEGKNVWGYG